MFGSAFVELVLNRIDFEIMFTKCTNSETHTEKVRKMTKMLG